MAKNETFIHPTGGESSKEIVEFTKEGEAKIEIGKFKDVTLVLGLSGSGKSTLTQFLTGNDEGLTAVETRPGSEEFIFRDKNHNVCQGTIDSCTIIPKLYVDEETKSGFYDCPGFGDTRSVKHDISVTYFINKVIDSVDSVKLLFTTNHHSVREGMDRQTFMKLVHHALKMVKKIDKFKDGIALVVTKVDNQYYKKKKQLALVPDEIVIGNIAQFLENAKETLKDKLQQSKNDYHCFNTNAIKLIDILLEKEGDKYSRISLFRRPDEEGPISESILLQSGKEYMQKVLQSTSYIPKTKEDFGYTVSAESLNQMHGLIQQTNEKLSAVFNKIGLAIQDHYTLEESKCKDIEALQTVLAEGHDSFTEIMENRDNKSLILLAHEIGKLAETENINIPTENLSDVAHYDQFLNFINEISALPTSSIEWLNAMNDAVDDLRDKRDWLTLLVNVQTSMSDYAVLNVIRENPTSANALKNCINKIEQLKSENGNCAGLEDFLKQIFKKNVEEEHANARNFKPNVHEWELLKELLNFRVESSCSESNSQLILKGQYVKLSDILEYTHQCSSAIRTIKIFASRKVFINRSYSSVGNEVELVIIAPIWEVVGRPTIQLDGADGEDRYARRFGNQGRDGGNGGEGGMFWGMGQNCLNCQFLSVSANGGRGGAGEDGGDGANGRDFHATYEGDQHGRVLITIFYNVAITDYIHYGDRGGRGGDGGDGGQGGPKGMAKFALFGDGLLPQTRAVQGRSGAGGAGGRPGRGGRSERRIHRVQAALFVPWWEVEVVKLPSAADGSWGKNGGVRNPLPRATGKFSNPSQTLHEYTTFLQSKTDNSLSDSITRAFLQNVKTVKIDDVEHHVGRRSVALPNDRDEEITSNGSKKIKKASDFISSEVKPLKSSGRLSSNTEASVNNYKHPSVQGINTESHQTYNIPKIASSNGEVQSAVNDFGVSHVQSNLILLDYLYRMNKKTRPKFTKNRYSVDSDYAHRMAYRAHIE